MARHLCLNRVTPLVWCSELSSGLYCHLWNVGRQSIYTAVQPRRQLWTSYSPPWELENATCLLWHDLSYVCFQGYDILCICFMDMISFSFLSTTWTNYLRVSMCVTWYLCVHAHRTLRICIGACDELCVLYFGSLGWLYSNMLFHRLHHKQTNDLTAQHVSI
jgi:hypothetical protein